MYREYVRKWWLLKTNRIICPEVAVNGQFLPGKLKFLLKLPDKIEILRKFYDSVNNPAELLAGEFSSFRLTHRTATIFMFNLESDSICLYYVILIGWITVLVLLCFLCRSINDLISQSNNIQIKFNKVLSHPFSTPIRALGDA